jgi:hypothetical protein
MLGIVGLVGDAIAVLIQVAQRLDELVLVDLPANGAARIGAELRNKFAVSAPGVGPDLLVGQRHRLPRQRPALLHLGLDGRVADLRLARLLR